MLMASATAAPPPDRERRRPAFRTSSGFLASFCSTSPKPLARVFPGRLGEAHPESPTIVASSVKATLLRFLLAQRQSSVWVEKSFDSRWEAGVIILIKIF